MATFAIMRCGRCGRVFVAGPSLAEAFEHAEWCGGLDEIEQVGEIRIYCEGEEALKILRELGLRPAP